MSRVSDALLVLACAGVVSTEMETPAEARLLTETSIPAEEYDLRATWEGKSAEVHQTLYAPILKHLCPKVAMATFDYPQLNRKLRGVMATANLRKGEILCQIKVDEFLSEYTITNSSLASMLHRRRAKRQRALVPMLAIFILREGARESSRHMPYIKATFEHHEWENIPALWPIDSERKKAADPLLRSMAYTSAMRRNLSYNRIFPAAFDEYSAALSEGICGGRVCSRRRLEEVFSRENFNRVHAIIDARDWFLPMYSSDATHFLVPGLDLLNFGQVGIILSFDAKKHSLVATATKPVKKGSELLFFYGRECSEVMMDTYGFVPPTAKPCRRAPRSSRVSGRDPKASPS